MYVHLLFALCLKQSYAHNGIIMQDCSSSAVARCQILGGHTVNRDVGYGVHSYINLKILGGHVPVCPPYEYGTVYSYLLSELNCQSKSLFDWQGKSQRRRFHSVSGA